MESLYTRGTHPPVSNGRLLQHELIGVYSLRTSWDKFILQLGYGGVDLISCLECVILIQCTSCVWHLIKWVPFEDGWTGSDTRRSFMGLGDRWWAHLRQHPQQQALGVHPPARHRRHLRRRMGGPECHDRGGCVDNPCAGRLASTWTNDSEQWPRAGGCRRAAGRFLRFGRAHWKDCVEIPFSWHRVGGFLGGQKLCLCWIWCEHRQYWGKHDFWSNNLRILWINSYVILNTCKLTKLKHIHNLRVCLFN